MGKKLILRMLLWLTFSVAMLGAFFVGSIPFLFSFIVGLVIKYRVLAISVSLTTTVALTFLSANFPELFRFGNTHIAMHYRVFVLGLPWFVPNLLAGIFFAYVGVLSGIALKEGFQLKSKSPALPKG